MSDKEAYWFRFVCKHPNVTEQQLILWFWNSLRAIKGLVETSYGCIN